jgi:hypothetical protein
MVDVPLRHKVAAAQPPRRNGVAQASPGRFRASGWLWAGLAAACALAGAWLYATLQPQGVLDLTGDRTPVTLEAAGHSFIVPANMLRVAALRGGGRFERVDLVLHWPDLDGYTEKTAADFNSGDPRAPIIYATIGKQLAPLDATARLDTVYARFFSGKPVAGPAGLVGRTLSNDSGFGGEVVYFVPGAPQPFVARCPATETPEMPATCLRDINFGGDLTILFRFDRSLLSQWQQMEAGMRRLAANVLVR